MLVKNVLVEYNTERYAMLESMAPSYHTPTPKPRAYHHRRLKAHHNGSDAKKIQNETYVLVRTHNQE